MDETSPKPFVFVLMPFSDEFTDTYEVGIKPACRDAGAYCERVDEQIFLENIIERVYNQIAKADIIIAEMTGRNPNVFYEVGYAHALNKIVILLTRNSDDIPFDLKHYPHIVYKGSITNLKSQLEPRVRWCIQNPKKSELVDEFNLKLYIDGKIHHEGIQIDAKRDRNDIMRAEVKLDFYNNSNRVFQEKSTIGIIIPEEFSIKILLSPANIRSGEFHEGSAISLPDKKRLYDIGRFYEILPNAWESFTFLIHREYFDYELESIGCAERNNFFTSYSMIVRIFTVFGPKDFPLSLLLKPANES